MANDMLVKIDEFGRVLIPKRIRDHLGLKPGITITLTEISGEKLMMQIIHKKPILKEVDSVLVFQGKAVADIDKALDELRNERLHKLMGDYE